MVSLWRLCQKFKIPPRAWMRPNPFKIYEFYEVTSKANLRKEHSVIDLGCGKGYWTLLLAEKCKYAVGVDPSADSIRFAREFVRGKLKERVHFVPAMLEDSYLPADTYDRIFSFCVLEHIVDLQATLKSAFSLLKPGGEMHVSVDSLANIQDGSLLDKHKQEHAVFQYFTTASIRDNLEKVGFEVMQIYPIMTSDFAREQFEERILGNYKFGFWRRMQVYRKFQLEDLHSANENGMVLIVRARRPNR